MSKRLKIDEGKDGRSIRVQVLEEDRHLATGAGEDVEQAAGWVLYHLRRHIEEAEALFARLGIRPASEKDLTPAPAPAATPPVSMPVPPDVTWKRGA